MIEAFTIERIGKSGSKFDPDKTRWFNQQYLRNTPLPELAEMLMPLLKEKGFDVTADYAGKVAHLMMERAVFVKDMLEGDYLFQAPTSYDQEAVAKRWKVGESADLMKEWGNAMGLISDFSVENIDAAFKQFLTDKSLGMGAVMPLFRLLLTGTLTGPAAAQVAALIGKEEVMRRIELGIQKLG
jgi:glutamyl-tRNA synthetase